MISGFSEEFSVKLGFEEVKYIKVIVQIKEIRENENKRAHNRGCICGIKKYPLDNLSLTSLGYFLTNFLRLKDSFNKIFWANSF